MSVESIEGTAQYITFKLDDELFAINVSQVRKVLDLALITIHNIEPPRIGMRWKTELIPPLLIILPRHNCMLLRRNWPAFHRKPV